MPVTLSGVRASDGSRTDRAPSEPGDGISTTYHKPLKPLTLILWQC